MEKAFLSLGGRITLIQANLTHIPSYFLSFQDPNFNSYKA